ncbi:DUF3846 domain-containing protein [Spirosoma sp. RP8]|uniref:DUF3846 domain-containing protein n=1 Tax=Spirosoma liriopis TaxID=2937440 RepID=A0ABT0HWF4_9BACT|nr:DUF3846 domain-containing protein [Spirosoma liriopis]MCK8495845.1 DUF3846 domain-containing protein [Spirosoma liriopis]
MKAIKIDVEKQDVYDLEIESGITAMYTAISCTCVDRVVLDDETDLWLDDEGLLHEPQPTKFSIAGFDRSFAGNGLICGYNAEGQTISTTLTAEQVRPLITFRGNVPTTIEPTIVISF